MNNKFIKNLSGLLLSSLLSQILLLLSTPVLTRLFSPEELGIYASLSSILSILAVGACLRYEFSISASEKEREINSLVTLSCITSIIIIFITITIFAIFHIPEKIIIGNHIYYIPLGIITYGFYRAMSFNSIRKRQYREFSITKIAQTVTMISIQIIGGIASLGASSLILGQILGQSLGVLFLRKKSQYRLVIRKNEFRKIRLLAKKYYKFPVYDFPASLINTVSNELPQLFIMSAYGLKPAGFYLIASKISGAPITLLNQTVSSILQGYLKGTPASSFLKIKKTFYYLGLISLLFAIVTYLIGIPTITFVFGEEWYESGKYLLCLIPHLSGQIIYSSLSIYLSIYEHQKSNLFIQSTSIILRFTALLVGYLLGDIYLTLLLFSLTSFSLYLMSTAYILRLSFMRKRGLE
ncbi:lipopolysaccharide biosynthesis protein [Photorhabdus temperata]|uniref:Membrane protein involved in the export of O-antigen and teichoic acid n=1 Tax=Photorhabdus temperata subsp. temperata Meg1 TaxID=1393735 RepID=A0A081RV02_PHOTE|nr:oligosaccharide flippase family protein [Photorhabdus temperata]KER02505.1 membrane protein involved in the export of O-antigen and teichoic acid [Photorhabdus temperata subsp. temperata Meg1]